MRAPEFRAPGTDSRTRRLAHIGTNRALAALARDVIPTDSAAKMAIAEVPTAPLEMLRDD